MVRSPVTWTGGKFYMATWIISRFPEHTHYIEVFGGALHVLFRKFPMALETVNDLDGELVNFWMVCRDNYHELMRKLHFTPYSRLIFEKWKREAPTDDPVERAARWYYRNCAAVNSAPRGGWRFQKSRYTVNVPVAQTFRRRVDRISAARDRLAEVQIESADFRVMFERYSHDPENLLYCDPPYMGYNWYRHNFTEEDHRDLAELASQVEAKVAISYEENEMIRKLYKGWHIETLEQVRHGKVSRSPKKTAVELLITNYQKQPTFDFDNQKGEDVINDDMATLDR